MTTLRSAEGAIDVLAVPAVRYALGRRTYVVADVARTLVAHRDALALKTKAAIVREITADLDAGLGGDEIDRHEWRLLRDALSDERVAR